MPATLTTDTAVLFSLYQLGPLPLANRIVIKQEQAYAA